MTAGGARGWPSLTRYLSPDGQPITMDEWVELFDRRTEEMGPESWWRKQTDIGDGVEVSTVWLGLNHQFLDGAPLFWETMISRLGDDGREWWDGQWRYSSKQAAWDDHERIVRALREGRDP